MQLNEPRNAFIREDLKSTLTFFDHVVLEYKLIYITTVEQYKNSALVLLTLEECAWTSLILEFCSKCLCIFWKYASGLDFLESILFLSRRYMFAAVSTIIRGVSW
jgi:hypothetical protein